MADHDIRITQDLKERFSEWAYDNSTTASAAARQIIAEYGQGPADEVVIPESGDVNLRVTVTDTDWAAASTRARLEGISLAQVVRREIAATIGD